LFGKRFEEAVIGCGERIGCNPMNRGAALLLVLAGCGPPADGEKGAANEREEVPNEVAATPARPGELEASRAASETVRLYYQHIGRSDYSAAFALRAPQPGLTLERFAASFERFADYRATVGIGTLPAEQDGALWVAVPVQLYGRMRDGSPFGSAGRVTLKRERGAQVWRIHG
jgi:hypothetical protein